MKNIFCGRRIQKCCSTERKERRQGEKENRTEKYEAQNPENRSIFNPDRVSVEEYDKTLRDQVNKYYEHLKMIHLYPMKTLCE